MIVLDTHVWVWWLTDPNRLPRATAELIETQASDGALYLSSISTWEVCLLNIRGRLELSLDVRDWIARAESLPYFQFVPPDNSILVRSAFLPEPFHADPADRIIVATALTLDASIVTKDRKIHDYPVVKTVWQ